MGPHVCALGQTRAWSERAVHEIVLRDSDHVDASTAYQIRLPVESIRDFEPTVKPGDRVRLLLPFTVRPKHLLLNVDCAGMKIESAASGTYGRAEVEAGRLGLLWRGHGGLASLPR